MDLDFSEDQTILREEFRRVLAEECSTNHLRWHIDAGGGIDHALWSTVADLGWLGIPIPERFGGLGLGSLELCVLAEELGRAAAPLPIVSSSGLVARAIDQFAGEKLKAKWLPALAAGKVKGAFAPHEPGSSVTQANVQDDGTISGVKSPVADLPGADIILVASATGLALVEAGAAGVTIEVQRAFDPLKGVGTLRLDGAATELIAGPSAGAALLNDLAILTAFEQIGGAQRCLEMAVTYTRERFVFGRPVGSFQAVKHKLADVLVAIEIARSNAYYAAWMMAQAGRDATLAAAAARLSAIRAYDIASRENLHVHGGFGFTFEADCHFYYRNAQWTRLLCGGPVIWSEKLIGALDSHQEAGDEL
jgi:alkylation response protein AidB-like acyl-CoA dehydrogenase